MAPISYPNRSPYRSFLRNVWHLSYPYFKSSERWRARGLFGMTVLLNLSQVYFAVLFNQWYQLFYNALDRKDRAEFWHQLMRFAIIAFLNVAAIAYRTYCTQTLEMRWRRWLTHDFLRPWLRDRAAFQMEIERSKTDNPDERISEDLKQYVSGALGLTFGFLNAAVSLVSFIGILWAISGSVTFMLGRTEVTIPAYMVWAALLYAGVGSCLAYFIGKPLPRLNFNQLRFEADFRFGLAKLRGEAARGAAVHWEGGERRSLSRHFASITRNWWRLIKAQRRLTWFTSGYTQIALIFPFMVASPRFFAGALTLGSLIRIADSFEKVRVSLSWFIDNFAIIAAWRANVNRLLTFPTGPRNLGRVATEGFAGHEDSSRVTKPIGSETRGGEKAHPRE